MWSLLSNVLAGSVSGWIKERAELAKQKNELQLQRINNGISGWSDEYLTLVWSAPFVACFVPAWREEVSTGFELLAALPEWYLMGFGAVTAGVFGFNNFLKIKK